MREELEAIKTAWENRPAAGIVSSSDEGDQLSRHDNDVVVLADAFVAANPDLFNDLVDKDLPECVESLDKLRDAGLTELEWLVQTWIFHKFEFQNIGGTAQAVIRVVNGA